MHSLKISRYVDEELHDTAELVDMRAIGKWYGLDIGELVHVAISPDSTSVAVIHGDKISVWEVTFGDTSCANTCLPGLMVTTCEIQQPDFQKGARYVCLTHSPDCRFLAVISIWGRIDIFRNHNTSMFKAASVDTLFKTFPTERSQIAFVKSVAWSPYEDLLAAGLNCGVVPVAITKYLLVGGVCSVSDR